MSSDQFYGPGIPEMLYGKPDHDNPMINSIIQCEKIMRDIQKAILRNRQMTGVFNFYRG